MTDYRDQTVVVTGGAGEIGEAVVRRFLAEGASVIVADVQAQRGRALADELGERCHFVQLDVADEAAWQRLLEVLEREQPCKALVQCAGVIEVASVADQEPANFRRVIDINLFGTWLGMHVLGSAIRRTSDSVIVNFSSTHGIYAKANMGAYAASKWAIRGLTKSAALEFASSGVRVLSIHPGPIRTEFASSFDKSGFPRMAIPRFGEPAEVAEMTWFMASQATYSTGTEFVMDGGILMGAIPPTS
jgi:3alpha(or 20beta)-hydroxysteroid dehydrogenase